MHAGVPFDVLTIGRVGVDFYPTTHGSIVEVRHFDKFLGGSPSNVAVGHEHVSVNEHRGDRHRTGRIHWVSTSTSRLRNFGVDDRFVASVEGLQTPVTFCEIFPPDRFPIYFYRAPKAPDLEIYPEELDLDAIHAARLFWATVSGLSAEPSRAATMAALAHALTPAPDDARSRLSRLVLVEPRRRDRGHRAGALHATIAVGNLEEVEVAVGTRVPTARPTGSSTSVSSSRLSSSVPGAWWPSPAPSASRCRRCR